MSGLQPLGNVRAVVYDANNVAAGEARTDAGGGYQVTGLAPGSYRVCFDAAEATGGSWRGGYADQCYSGTPWSGIGAPTGTPVVVSNGQVTSGVDAALVSAAIVTGTVTAAVSGQPLSGVGVRAFRVPDDGVARVATTGQDGTYSLGGLPPGSYAVCFDATHAVGGAPAAVYYDQCYLNAPWDGGDAPGDGSFIMSFVAGSTTTGIDARLVLK